MKVYILVIEDDDYNALIYDVFESEQFAEDFGRAQHEGKRRWWIEEWPVIPE